MADPLVQDLLKYIDASPTPFHAVAETARRLKAAGYVELNERDTWQLEAGAKVYIVRGGGSIAAFELGTDAATEAGFVLIGAHTDSPNLRIKPNPDVRREGCLQLGVERYGGALLHTWLDRDLGIAGRIATADGVTHLIDRREPIMRIPSLAIHLDRTVNTDGLKLNAQQHMAPVWGLGSGPSFLEVVATQAGVQAADLLSWDLMTYVVQPAVLAGVDDAFIHAGRLDNLASCHAALHALLQAGAPAKFTRGVILYDHEEVGSRSARGAASDFLRSTLRRISGPSEETYRRAISRSFQISVDMAHGVHPNYADRHEPEHRPRLGSGPVIKFNSDQNYATDATSWARFEQCAREVGVHTQRFVVRSDLACGSTIGPISAVELGISTVDVGNPMLSMHSAREMAASADVVPMINVLERCLAG